MKITALYTSFNRKVKTLSSIQSLFDATEYYNKASDNPLELTVYLTDDGSTDGTSEAIRKEFPNHAIRILQGNGELYWAGGMRLAWNEAIRSETEWDYYLLLNDDTELKEDCINELLSTQLFCEKKYGKKGLISGITCSKGNPDIITYGGDRLTNRWSGTAKRLGVNETPQMVDLTNANILLVPRSVVDAIGIFYSKYQHGRADSDYAMTARKHDIPVLITAKPCGYCENDHGDLKDLKNRVLSMDLKQRKAYFSHPLHSSKDYLLFVRRNFPIKYPIAVVFRFLNVYFPTIYYAITLPRLK